MSDDIKKAPKKQESKGSASGNDHDKIKPDHSGHSDKSDRPEGRRFLSKDDLDDLTRGGDFGLEDDSEDSDDSDDDFTMSPEGGQGVLIDGGGTLGILGDLMGQITQLLHGNPEELRGLAGKSLSLATPEASAGPSCPLVNNPMEVLEDGDFDDDDDTVREFKAQGGPKEVVKILRINSPKISAEKIAALTSHLRKVHASSNSNSDQKSEQRRTFRRTSLMRVAFSQVKATQRGEGLEHQISALEKFDILLRASQSKTAVAAKREAHEHAVLAACKEAVLQGTDASLDAAAYRLKGIISDRIPASRVELRMADGTRPSFGQRVSSNGQPASKTGSRLAYTTLETQGDEGYLLCPKGLTEFGRAIPMEISKCRDHCVESRTSRDGTTSCHFANWLKVAADSNADAMARLEVWRNPDNDETLITLAEGERSKPVKDGEAIKPYEERFEDAKLHKKTGEGKTKLDGESFDAWLADTKPTSGGQIGEKVDRVKDNPGEPTASPRTAGAKSKPVLDPDCGETLGEQVETKAGGKKTYGDDVIEDLLSDERDTYSDEDCEALEQMLSDLRKNKKKK